MQRELSLKPGNHRRLDAGSLRLRIDTCPCSLVLGGCISQDRAPRDPGKKNDYPDKNTGKGSSHCGTVVMNPSNIHEDAGSIPGLAQGVKDPVCLPMSCGVGCRCSSDPMLLTVAVV